MKENPSKWRKKLGEKPSGKRRFNWTPERYRMAVEGGVFRNERGEDQRLPGLRQLAHGFDKDDGFDTRNVAKWSKGQREKVRDYFHRVEILSAQPHKIKRVRQSGKTKKEYNEQLRILHGAFHGDVPSSAFKVVFVPDTEPVLPGQKKRPMRIRLRRDGVVVERPGLYRRHVYAFNKKSLARDPKVEIARVAAKMPTASLFSVQVGQFQNIEADSLYSITGLILNWMMQYDGVRPLPKGSGNSGDNPKHHHWRLWLDKLIGYELPTHGYKARQKMARTIMLNRRVNQAERLSVRNFMRRERIDARREKVDITVAAALKVKRRKTRKGRK